MKTVIDAIDLLGPLALASRLRRLADEIFEEVNDLYLSCDFELNPRFFPLLHLISATGALGITDAAKRLGLTHPAVSQMASALRTQGLFVDEPDPKDERRRLMALSDSGKRLCSELRPIWEAVGQEAALLIGASGVDLLSALKRIENELHERKFSKRVRRRLRDGSTNDLEIVEWTPELSPAFHDLNREWIDRFFGSEKKDLETLKDPSGIILKDGGMVFFALVSGKPVGTGALVKKSDTQYEVVKMAVSRACRGSGIGEKLLSHMMMWAKSRGALLLDLETNSQLSGALKLYKRLGFEVLPHPNGKSEYERADVYMEIAFAGE